MEITKLYESWCKNAVEDQDLIAELESIRGNEKEIYERFYTALKFGTAGLRGVIGAEGTRRKRNQNLHYNRAAAHSRSLLSGALLQVPGGYHGYSQPQPRKI